MARTSTFRTQLNTSEAEEKAGVTDIPTALDNLSIAQISYVEKTHSTNLRSLMHIVTSTALSSHSQLYNARGME